MFEGLHQHGGRSRGRGHRARNTGQLPKGYTGLNFDSSTKHIDSIVFEFPRAEPVSLFAVGPNCVGISRRVPIEVAEFTAGRNLCRPRKSCAVN